MSSAATILAQQRRSPCPAAAAKRHRRRPLPAAAAAAAAQRADSTDFAIIGAGLAGLATAYHLADLAPPGSRVVVYDAGGIGAGGSGAAAGLLHPVSPRGRPLWGAGDAMRAAARALAAAEQANEGEEPLAWRTGMLRPAADLKQARDYGKAAAAKEDDQGCWLGSAPPRAVPTADEARALLPGVAARDWVEDEEEEEEEEEEETGEDAIPLDSSSPLSPEDAARRERQRRRTDRRRQRRRGGNNANDPPASALHVPSGITLHPHLYMRALWQACQDLCRAKGGSAELRLEKVASLAALLGQRRWRGVVVAAGAAVGALPEAKAAGLPDLLELVRGYSLDVERRRGGSGNDDDNDGRDEGESGVYPPDAPSLLGKPYLASRGGQALVVGAAAAPAALEKPTPEDALRLCCRRREGDGDGDDGGNDDNAAAATAAAERELLEGAARAWPPFAVGGGNEKWRVARVRSGVRAVPPRSPEGALPLVGRLALRTGDDGGGDAEVWVVAGLGARGLVYHAWLGELAARGLLERTEAHIPRELLRWREEGEKRRRRRAAASASASVPA